MIIQKIVFPTEDICNEKEMYFHGETVIQPGQSLGLDSYFNSFSIGKWRSYTILDQLSLRIETTGEVEISAYHSVGSVDDKIKKAWEEEQIHSCIHAKEVPIPVEISCEKSAAAYCYTVAFQDLPEEGVFFVSLKNAGEEAVEFLGGAYETAIAEEALNPVYLALGICTFQREEFLKKNVNLILEKIMNNPESPLYGKVEVYISDNGQTVPEDTFLSSFVHLFPNKNAGGAGGFTRTMMEALFRRTNSPFTHMILMDDDIVLSTDVLERTYHLLQLLSDNHKNMMVGGEMFSLSKRYQQYEAGASWFGTVVTFYNRYWDMRRKECVVANEVQNPLNYSGWWYSVIPASIIREDNLPIPLFIHYDDMEYGARNQENGTILMNGICVWHPQGVNKAPVRMIYYDIRNMMISMSALPNRATAGEVVTMLMNRVIGAVIRYNYEEAEVCFEALEDFYKGPEWFMALDPLEKHPALTKYNYEFVTPEEAGVNLEHMKNKAYNQTPLGKLVFLWGLLLWILPAFRKVKVAGLEDIGLPFGAKKIYHYDPEKGMGHISVKSYGRAWKDFIRYWKVVHMVKTQHEEMMDRWAEAKPLFTNRDFWEKYLEI